MPTPPDPFAPPVSGRFHAAWRSLRESTRALTPLIASALVLLGCGDSPPTFESVIDGTVTLDAPDRQAVLELISDAGAAPEAVRLLDAEASVLGAAPALRIADGRVVGLSLDGVTSPEPVAILDALEELELGGRYRILELSGHSHLEFAVLRSVDGSLERLRLADLPALETLSIDGCAAEADLDLGSLPGLTSLSITQSQLSSVPGVDAPQLTSLSLSGNRIANLSGLATFEALHDLQLSDNGIETLDTLPELAKLRVLRLSGNPLRPDSGSEGAPDLGINRERLPSLASLDLRRTDLSKAPASWGDDLRVKIDPEKDFQTLLDRLRRSTLAAPGELVAGPGATGGMLRDTEGNCRWRVGTFHRAQVDCRILVERLSGTAGARLGTTDVALPFQGGGEPRIRATLRVRSGQAAIYVRTRFDLVQTARFMSEVDDATAEAASRPTDRFDGYRRVVARPGEPAVATGGITLLGSRVVLWIEAIGGQAEGIELVVEPI